MIQNWVVIPDLQVPLHNEGAVKALQKFVKDTQPAGLLCVGDEIDSTQIGKWVRGLPGEYEDSFQAQVDATFEVLSGFRQALGKNKPFILSRSNHGETRIVNYVNRNAPALRTLRDLEYARLMGFEELGITYVNKPTEVLPNVLLCHGDEGSQIQTPGGTAMGLAKKWGKSVISGHTHKLGFQHANDSVNGLVTRALFGFEVGHLMDFGAGESSATYLKAGSANWQAGFGILKYDTVSGHVQPVPVPIDVVGKRFIVDNKVYTWK